MCKLFFLKLGYYFFSIERGKTTTVVTADTTISSNTQPNDNNELKDFIRAEELIQKHFDIPLVS